MIGHVHHRQPETAADDAVRRQILPRLVQGPHFQAGDNSSLNSPLQPLSFAVHQTLKQALSRRNLIDVGASLNSAVD